ncbi:bcl-2-like protein 11 [Hypomesus transpacificus]|uniref:bcl-2-like protein 11 n=1 Tax=Hypomesus transpacificus TaxID=137520 RepID=UPI001F072750|nr:bcl-2-like protein 11 [Hypomesus transpacificus]
MSDSSRPRNWSDDSTNLNEREKSGESHPGGRRAFRAETSDNPQSYGEGEPSRGGITMPNSLLVFHSRSPMFRPLSRSSSGYFSFDSDSLPSSPLLKHNKSTQTPSPSSQVITHALQRMSNASDTGRDYETWPSPARPYRPHPAPPEGDMQGRADEERRIGQELQRIGDDFMLIMLGRLTDRNRRVAQPNLLMDQEPAFLQWMTLLIGRLLQMLLRRR